MPAVRKDIWMPRILGPGRRMTEGELRPLQPVCPRLSDARRLQFRSAAPERRNRNIDQVPHGEVRGLEINADHRSNFKIDEQEEDVAEARPTWGGHSDESCSR